MLKKTYFFVHFFGFLLSDFFPELIIPAGNTEEEATSPEVASTPAATTDAPLKKDRPVATDEPQNKPTNSPTPETAIVSLTPPSPSPPPTGKNDETVATGNMLWTVGAGVALSLLTLFVATFVVLRPR